MKYIKLAVKIVLIIIVIAITYILSFTYLLKRWPIPSIVSAPSYIPKEFSLMIASNSQINNHKQTLLTFADSDLRTLDLTIDENQNTDCQGFKSNKIFSILSGPSLTKTADYCYVKMTSPKGDTFVFIWGINNNKYRILTSDYQLSDYELLKISETTYKKKIIFNDLKLLRSIANKYDKNL